MNPATALLVIDAISLADKLLANYLGKPSGWKPTPQDWEDFHATVDAASPEAVKKLAMERLGLTERIPYTPE